MSTYARRLERSRAFAFAATTAVLVCTATRPANADSGTQPIPDGHAPAGVMVDHMHKAGEVMVGYRYSYSRNDGDFLNGTSSKNDQAIRHNGCLFPGQDPKDHATHNHCDMKPSDMSMHMHMLDIMYAPTDWMTLMVMPQWMSMDMSMSPVAGGGEHGGDHGGGHHGGGHTGSHAHGTDGIGDTTFGTLIKLSDGPGYHLHTGLMLSAPTGSVGEKGSDGVFTHYHMQLGSGTWDFLPSLTYTGAAGLWSWGAQASGVLRLEDENESGYALGDVFQATGWGSYRISNLISASIRLVHTSQSQIEGHYNGPHNHSSPVDLQRNYGGRFWDVGFGVNMVVPDGALKGHRLSVEWLEPLRDDVNGYQLERDGTLFANWSKAF